MQAIQARSNPNQSAGRTPDFHQALISAIAKPPVVGISLCVHFIALFVLLSVPWGLKPQHHPVVFHWGIPLPPGVEIEAPSPIVDPIICCGNEIDPDPSEYTSANSDRARKFETRQPVIEPLTGPGGWLGNRAKQGAAIISIKAEPRKPRPPEIERALENLATQHPQIDARWPTRQQAPAGFWTIDGFAQKRSPRVSNSQSIRSDALENVGITSLALLALLDEGSSTAQGPHRASVARGVRWIVSIQENETGLIGHQESAGHHALAMLALAENYLVSKNPIQRRALQNALKYIDDIDPTDQRRPDAIRLEAVEITTLKSWIALVLNSNL